MKTVNPRDDWPPSWHESYRYDLMEVYGEYRIFRGYSQAYNLRRRRALQMVRSVSSPRARILDVAAAQGNFTLALAEMGYDVTWNDLRPELADYVRMKQATGQVSYVAGNIFEMEFDGAFDLVLATEVIEHMAHPDQFLRAVAKLVKPNGHIVLTTPNGSYFRNRLPRFSDCADPSVFESVQFRPNADGHIFLLHLDEIHRFSRDAGLSVTNWELYTNSLSGGALGTDRLLPFIPRCIVTTLERLTNAAPLFVRKKLHMGVAVLLKKDSRNSR